MGEKTKFMHFCQEWLNKQFTHSHGQIFFSLRDNKYFVGPCLKGWFTILCCDLKFREGRQFLKPSGLNPSSYHETPSSYHEVMGLILNMFFLLVSSSLIFKERDKYHHDQLKERLHII